MSFDAVLGVFVPRRRRAGARRCVEAAVRCVETSFTPFVMGQVRQLASFGRWQQEEEVVAAAVLVRLRRRKQAAPRRLADWGVPRPRPSLVGRRVMVPREVWPDEEPPAGQSGWMAVVSSQKRRQDVFYVVFPGYADQFWFHGKDVRQWLL